MLLLPPLLEQVPVRTVCLHTTVQELLPHVQLMLL